MVYYWATVTSLCSLQLLVIGLNLQVFMAYSYKIVAYSYNSMAYSYRLLIITVAERKV